MGGAGGIGRAIALVLASRPEVRRVDIVDRAPLAPIADETAGAEKLAVHRFDLESGDFSFFDRFVQGDTDGLFIHGRFRSPRPLRRTRRSLHRTFLFTVNSVSAYSHRAPILRAFARSYTLSLCGDGEHCRFHEFSVLFYLRRHESGPENLHRKVSMSNSNVPARPIVCSMFRPVRSREPDFRAARPISN